MMTAKEDVIEVLTMLANTERNVHTTAGQEHVDEVSAIFLRLAQHLANEEN